MKEIPVSTRNHILCLLTLLCLMVILHFPLLKIRGFMPKDDWKPLRYILDRPCHHQVEQNIRDFGFVNLKWEWDLGRFTPVYNLVQVLEAYAFEASPLLWHLETLGLGFISLALLYMIFIRLGVSIFPAFLAGLWFLARGRELWVEKQYQEELGVLFLLAAVFFFVKAAQAPRSGKWDWAAMISLVSAGLTKETFVFLYPSVLLLRIFLERFSTSPQPITLSLKRLRPVLITTGLIFLGQTLLILYLYLEGAYAQNVVGGLFEFRASRIARMLREIGPHFSFFLPALGLILLIPKVRQRRIRPDVLLVAALVLVFWLGPQILIFKSRGFSGHYVYSAIPGFIALNVLGLEILRKHHPKLGPWLFSGLCLVSAYTIWLTLPTTRNEAEFQVARANAYREVVQRCTDSLGEDGSVLLVSDRPWWGLGISFLFDLSRAGKDCPVYFEYGNASRSRLEGLPASPIGIKLIDRYFPPFEPEYARTIDIIVATRPAARFLASAQKYSGWFKEEDWAAFPIRVGYHRFGTGSVFKPVLERIPSELEYTVFARKK